MAKTKVWDLPTRLFHWGLVSVFVFQFVTGDILDSAMQLHIYGGYVALGLILFRIIWGFVGSYHARFVNFVYSPATAIDYLTGKHTQIYLGHNPLGGYSVLAILAVMLTQAVSGLFMTDDIFLDGPYHGALGSGVDDTMNFLHHNAFTLMWGLIGLHLIAIAYYTLKKKKALIPAMIHGNKPIEKADQLLYAASLNDSPSSPQLHQKAAVATIHKVTTPWIAFAVSAMAVVLLVYLVVEVFAPAPEVGLYGY
jgi:cytochrome b